MSNLHKRQLELVREYRATGSNKAMFELIESCMGLIVNQMLRVSKWSSIEREDAISEGQIAIYEAVRLFDEDRGAPFSACALFCIRSAIQNTAQKQTTQLSFGSGRTETKVQRKIFTYLREAEEVGFTPDECIEYAALCLGITRRYAEAAISMRSYSSVNSDDIDLTTDADVAFEGAQDNSRRELIDDILSDLTEDERTLIKLKYLSEERVHQKEIIRIMGTTPHKAAALEKEAMMALRAAVIARGLELSDVL